MIILRIPSFVVALVFASGICSAQVQTPEGFEKRTFTELNQNYWHSADTFSLKVNIKNGTRSQHFRLHGVNSPEPDDQREAELTADSARFRLSTEQILLWGDHAKQAVRRTLQDGGTIYTKRVPAGEIQDRRYVYAIVLDSKGRDLAGLLIEAGLAAYDPDASPLTSSVTALPRSHEVAIRSRRGIWAHARAAIPALPVKPQPGASAAVLDPLPELDGKPWIVYEDGKLAEDYYSGDGDSFALTSKSPQSQRSSTQVWRLYAIDCPESDNQIPERVQSQARHFGVSTATVMNYGKRSATFAQRFLAQGPATVYTVREDARGASSKKRYYALVRVNGQDLGLALVREGLALSGSMPLPGKSRDALRFRQLLDKAESEAKAARRGIWQSSSQR
ncbi:hypothetical protein FEM03_13705 [Phragmitibacter flavus]|uniref:TNase-like domain-containing protein n=1 Tax=Phragmitibacter flavus TaxID=2576071 RepID=A0A5R8KD54_9BACT|nr:thermonuclease family protein [Phragmitibacter flavus]TLD70236.1 hypothetical protein FEM03_13705 [Phragmitibacter flavus]